MISRSRCILSLPALLLFTCFSFAGEGGEEKVLNLAIGNPKVKNQVLDIHPDEIQSSQKGKPVSFEKMIQEMKKSRFVYVGEEHDSLPIHDIQLKVLQALYAQDNRLAIGLEMLPVTLQATLEKWSQGILSKDEFIHEVQWYVNWNFNFGFYEKIFAFAKENKIPIYALNVPRDIITKIRMKGWEALSDDEKKLVPEPDLSHQEHRLLIRTIFENTELPPQMKGAGLEMVFEGLYRGESAWDEVMASNAIAGASKEGKKIVVLAGSGHLLYNLGINRRVHEKNHLPLSTVIVVSVAKEKKAFRVARSLGDFIWGIPEEERPAFPSVGLSFKKFEGLENLVIEREPIDGVAKGADFKKGDVVLSVDGEPFGDINGVRTYLARFKWSDEVKFRLLRSGDIKEVILKFELPKSSEDKKGN